MNKCPHCNIELEEDKKTGALVCPKCHCVFRVCLVRYEPKCYAKMFPQKGEIKEKRKRGRPKKIKEVSEDV